MGMLHRPHLPVREVENMPRYEFASCQSQSATDSCFAWANKYANAPLDMALRIDADEVLTDGRQEELDELLNEISRLDGEKPKRGSSAASRQVGSQSTNGFNDGFSTAGTPAMESRHTKEKPPDIAEGSGELDDLTESWDGAFTFSSKEGLPEGM